ncbi:hypothetical protein CVT24_007983 [Panaeolus cyanescens]|uniref:Uncharacterized protein n=1 Tax=Panaeolus cyanescens TaxID=181874 RepID=A0A409YQW0_9AGAR|nr:hypothetical protein CVT24_007983 [Panaeolus cyanescens]
MPTNFIWLGFFWLIGKCYVNSFLAARESLREQVAPQDGTFLQLTPFRAMGSAHHSEPPSPSVDLKENIYHNGPAPQALAVTVQTQTITRCDYEYVVSTVSLLPFSFRTAQSIYTHLRTASHHDCG